MTQALKMKSFSTFNERELHVGVKIQYVSQKFYENIWKPSVSTAKGPRHMYLIRNVF